MKNTNLCAIPQPYAGELARLAPSISFSVSREIDEHYRWDGDGPDPVEDDFDPYDVTVSARAVASGVLLKGEAFLGGSYFKDDEPTGIIHGYLLQMLDQATEDLIRSITYERISSFELMIQTNAVREYLKATMRAEYDTCGR